MSDSESDSDLAVEQYYPEDNLNAYRSPVVRPVDEEILAVASERQNIESNRTQVSVLVLCSVGRCPPKIIFCPPPILPPLKKMY
jgi:hypothetical protein